VLQNITSTGGVCVTPASGTGTVSGSGVVNHLALWNDTSSINDSGLTWNGDNMSVPGSLIIGSSDTSALEIINNSGVAYFNTTNYAEFSGTVLATNLNGTNFCIAGICVTDWTEVNGTGVESDPVFSAVYSDINTSISGRVPNASFDASQLVQNNTIASKAAITYCNNSQVIQNVTSTGANCVDLPGASHGHDQALNKTSNVTFATVNTTAINFMNSSGNGALTGYLYSGSGDTYIYSSTGISATALYSTGWITAVSGIQSNADLFTSGAGDDIWAGSGSQNGALFQANATGDIAGNWKGTNISDSYITSAGVWNAKVPETYCNNSQVLQNITATGGVCVDVSATVSYQSAAAGWTNTSTETTTPYNVVVTGNITVPSINTTSTVSYFGGLIMCNNGTATIMTRNSTLATNYGCLI
jgi:hypothetical protein